MLFNTVEYLLFFTGVLIVAWVTAGHRRFRNYFILLASFYFYFSNNGWQILLLLFTVTVDWTVCLRLANEPVEARRKALLAISLVSNLGVLFFFKYYNFASGSVVSLFGLVGWKLDWVEANILLPVGISFFTFEALSYTIDVYRGHIRAEREWSRLAFLVSFFPHLIAGPIVRAAQFFPQMDRTPSLTAATLDEALYLVVVGLFKKIVIADTLAIYADASFAVPASSDRLTLWLGVYAFSFQIFFDFSGYTDIARGCGKLLGYELPENFRRPYVAASMTEFWHRWHITLSTWLRDYLYISLGGNRMRTRWGVYRNLFITMFIGGLWHGAAWHFAIWGAIHGLALIVERVLGVVVSESGISRRARLLRAFATFNLVTFVWIPFRAESLNDAGTLFGRMILPGTPCCAEPTWGMAVVATIIATAWLWQIFTEFAELRSYHLAHPVPVKSTCYAVLLLAIFVVGSDTTRTFIYFQF
jgi:alginate O-acetyltransferase complex protein AlgI